jgi:hypothetical protein
MKQEVTETAKQLTRRDVAAVAIGPGWLSRGVFAAVCLPSGLRISYQHLDPLMYLVGPDFLPGDS